jgi:hypothetical protein
MKFSVLAAVAAIVPSFTEVAAAPAILRPATRLDVFQVATLGGATFRIQQVPNKSFIFGARRGPIALARAYSKFGIAIPPDLLSIIEAILKDLGLTLAKPNAGAGKGARPGTNTTVAPQGTMRLGRLGEPL